MRVKIADVNTRNYSHGEAKIRIVSSTEDAMEAQEYLLQATLLVCDVETLPAIRLMNVVGFSGLLESGEIRTYVFPLFSAKNHTLGSPADVGVYLAVIKEVLAAGIPTAFHNGAYDVFWLTHYGFEVSNYAYDTMTMFWALFPELPKTLAFVASVLLDDFQYWKGDRKSDSWHTFLVYNGKDCDRTMHCLLRLIEILITEPAAASNFMYAHTRVVSGISMSLRGLSANLDVRDKAGKKLHTLAKWRIRRLRRLVADKQFNPNSQKQKVELLYHLLGARKRNDRGRFVTKDEDLSAGAIPLRSMRADHPLIAIIAQAILDSMEPAKQISNVINMPLAIMPSGKARFYTSYAGTGTLTTRFSSSSAPINLGGNAQNIRKEYRAWLEADQDSVLFDIDFSAADDVFVSFESGDPKKIELFRSGLDTHSMNATLFFPNWTYDDVIRGKKAGDPRVVHPITGIRQITKKLSHGCNYLMAGLTLLMTAGREAIVAAAKELGHADAGLWTQERLADFCVHLESKYRDHYQRFKRSGAGSWYDELLAGFRDSGGFTTPFNYFERFLASHSDSNVIRGLAATAGQAGTAGRINAVLDEINYGIIMPRFRDAANPDAYDEPAIITMAGTGIDLRLQSHDSLTFNLNYRHPNWREGVRRIYKAMHRPVVILNSQTREFETFTVGLESEIGFGWGKALVGVPANTVESVELTLRKVLETRNISL